MQTYFINRNEDLNVFHLFRSASVKQTAHSTVRVELDFDM